MSTKTTFKRIALVTVAALGFGVLTSVAPATATQNSALAATVTVGTIPTPQVGVVNTTPVTVSYTGTAGGSDTFTVNVRVTSAPAGSQFRSLTTNLVTGVTASGNTIAAKLAIANDNNYHLRAFLCKLNFGTSDETASIIQRYRHYPGHQPQQPCLRRRTARPTSSAGQRHRSDLCAW